MRDSKPQRFVPQHKSLKMTRNARNEYKRIIEASKQSFTTICSKYHVKTYKVCFPIGTFVAMFRMHKIMTNFGVC